jgi:hypothetical protein
MIEELQAARDFFREVDDELEPLTMQILSELGIFHRTPEMMEALRQQTGLGDALPGLA